MAPLNENQAAVHATMAKRLPQYVIIQSNHNHRYLHYYTGNEDTPISFRYHGDYSFDVDTRFEVVQANTGTGLVHIRCVQNNRYWAKLSGNNRWVTTMADKPEENQSNQYCTLFQPIFMDDNNNRILRLRHVSSGCYVSLFAGAGNSSGLLYLSKRDNTAQDHELCTFISWKDVVMLPERIRLIDGLGYHLQAYSDGLMDFNQQPYENSSSFEFEVYPSRDGGIRLKNTHFGTYWTAMDDEPWLYSKKASSTEHDTRTVFFPTKVANKDEGKDKKDADQTVRIMFKSLKNEKFVRSYTVRGYRRNCLATIEKYPEDESNMVIELPYISRRIENVRYNHSAIKRYNEETTALITQRGSYETHGTSTLELTTEVTNKSNWSAGATITIGGSMSVSAGNPEISSVGVEVSGEVSGSVKLGKDHSETFKVGSQKIVTVKPGTRLVGGLMETRLSFDLPYSYTQRDVLLDGTTKLTEKNDGMFTGNHGYGYRYEIVEHPSK